MFGSAEVVAGLVALDSMTVLIPLVVYVHRRLAVSYLEVLKSMALPVIAAAVTLLVGLVLRSQLGDAGVSALPRLLLVALVALVAYVGRKRVEHRVRMRERSRHLRGRALNDRIVLRDLLKRALGGRPAAA